MLYEGFGYPIVDSPFAHEDMYIYIKYQMISVRYSLVVRPLVCRALNVYSSAFIDCTSLASLDLSLPSVDLELDAACTRYSLYETRKRLRPSTIFEYDLIRMPRISS